MKNEKKHFRNNRRNSKFSKKKKKTESSSFKINKQSTKDEANILEVNTLNQEEEQSQSKIAKYWKGSTLIDTKNTRGNLVFIESLNSILSISNGKVLALDISSLEIKKTFQAENEEVLAFEYNKVKKEIICLMNISMVRIFDFESESCINKFKLHKTVGTIVKLDPSGNFFAIVTSQNTIMIYETSKFNLECTFNGHSDIIYDIVFNPIKEKFTLYSCSEDNSVKVWNILLKKCTATFYPHTSSVRHAVLTNDGNFLISGTADNKIFIWKLSDHYTAEIPKPKIYSVENTFESIIYFTKVKEGKNIPSLLLGCDDGCICELNLQSGEIESENRDCLAQPIVQLYYSVGNEKVFALTNEQILIYLNVNIVNENISDASIEKLFPCYCQELLSVKYLPNSNNFLFASNDSILKFYNTQSHTVSVFEGHSDFIMSITIKQDLIITTSKDNTIRIWRWIYDENEFDAKCICVLKGHSDTVNCADIALKKTTMLVSGCKDGSVKMWDVKKVLMPEQEEEEKDDDKVIEISESLNSLASHEDEIFVVKYSPNEKLIASGSFDKTIKIYDYNLKLLSSLTGHRRGITDLSYSLYAKVLVSSSTDKTIKIWNLNDYSCLNTLEGHLSSVLKVDWIYHGTHLISAGADGLVKFWNIKNSECINTVDAHEGKIWALDVDNSKENLSFVTGGTDSKIVMWSDITAEKENEMLKEKEERMNKEDDLRMMNYNGEYIKALKLSIELGHKGDFVSTFKNYVNSVINTKLNTDNVKKSDIDLIIENRKIIDKEVPEIDLNSKYKESIDEIVNNKEIRELIKKNTEKVIEIIRDNNLKAGSFFYAQILLKILLKISRIEIFYKTKKDKEEEEDKTLLKKKRKRPLPKNYIENLEVVKMYSDKHLERIKKEISKSYMIDYSIEKMKLV